MNFHRNRYRSNNRRFGFTVRTKPYARYGRRTYARRAPYKKRVYKRKAVVRRKVPAGPPHAILNASNYLIHPFMAMNKGVKYPDQNASASVPITIRYTTALSATLGTNPLRGNFMRILPPGSLVVTTTGTTDATGKVTGIGTGTYERAPDWTTYDGNIRAMRVINYGFKLHYIGNSDDNNGKVTVIAHSYGDAPETESPTTSAMTAIYTKVLALKDCKGQVFEARRISSEALHYEPVTGTLAEIAAEYNDAWEAFSIFLENANGSTPQPLTIDIVWNMECLPLPNSIAGAMASGAAPDVPAVRATAANRAQRIDRMQEPNSYAASHSTGDYGSALQQAADLVNAFQRVMK